MNFWPKSGVIFLLVPWTKGVKYLYQKLIKEKFISFSSSEEHFKVLFSKNVFNLQKENRIKHLFALNVSSLLEISLFYPKILII